MVTMTPKTFKRIYSNIPETIRSQDVIAVVDDKPFTWNTAMIEIRNNTETGEKILRFLDRLFNVLKGV